MVVIAVARQSDGVRAIAIDDIDVAMLDERDLLQRERGKNGYHNAAHLRGIGDRGSGNGDRSPLLRERRGITHARRRHTAEAAALGCIARAPRNGPRDSARSAVVLHRCVERLGVALDDSR